MDRGILGGTFNPVHVGHLRIAEEVSRRCGIPEILFVPAREPWMKSAEELAPAEDRWEMVRLATEEARFGIPSRVDLDRPGPSFAIDTIRTLLASQASPASYHFIIGIDALLHLAHWKEPQALIGLCQIIVVSRPNYDINEASMVEDKVPGLLKKTRFIDGINIDVSSSGIRQLIKEGRTVDGLVPDAVASYIARNSLYGLSENGSGARGGAVSNDY